MSLILSVFSQISHIKQPICVNCLHFIKYMNICKQEFPFTNQRIYIVYCDKNNSPISVRRNLNICKKMCFYTK